jgi:hypothetical protein
MNQYRKSRPNNQDSRRFHRPVSLHVASAWVVAKLARERAITLEHAAVVADLAGIGGRRR